MGECKVTLKKSRQQIMADDWWEACSMFGEEEAEHVVAELWGYSLYKVKQEVKKIEEDSWL